MCRADARGERAGRGEHAQLRERRRVRGFGMRLFLVFVAACGSSGGPYFEQAMFFDRDVSGAAVSSTSKQTMTSLLAAGGWGSNNRLWIDFSFDVLMADHTTPKMAF